jgi:uncharacterized membrane protein YdbT with pleckstrin-like domain
MMNSYGEHNQPDPKNLHPMVVLQPGEQVVCEIKRHPIGIILMYVGSFIAIIIAVAVVFLLPKLGVQDTSQVTTISYGALVVVVVVILLVLAVATSIYWQNTWVVTTDSVTQVSQVGLFNRQVSQLSMDNLEDVTVDQAGILPHMFNYGTLRVETAGERSKFSFIYCPDPNACARQILDIHEKFLADRRDLQALHRPTINVMGSK